MEIISKRQWGSRETDVTDNYGELPRVYVHHTAGYFPKNVDEEEQQMRTLQNISIDTKGYQDTAYNWVIGPSGLVYEARGLNKMSAATQNENKISRTICLMGNFQNDTPTEPSIVACSQMICFLIDSSNLIQVRALEIFGHKDNPQHLGATACPGTNLYNKLPLIRELVMKHYDKPTPKPPTEGDEMELYLYQDPRYANVLLVTTAAVYQLTGTILADEKNKGLPYYNKEAHDQSLFSYMRKASLKAADMVLVGGQTAAKFPPDLM